MNLLTVNAGSSSIKFAVFKSGAIPKRIVSGKIERIGLTNARFVVRPDTELYPNIAAYSDALQNPSYADAIHTLVNWLEQHRETLKIAAISHRVVHGGHLFSSAQIITPAIMTELKRLCPFDPEHLPNEILLIETLQNRIPEHPQIACFDTAFHHDMPRVAQMLAIPRHYENKGLRRYGFHGLSYAFLMQQLDKVAGVNIANGRIILAHLGNGASLAAVAHGKPVDTSMGFTPSSGITMSTRSGDLDPGLVSYLLQSEHISHQQFNHLVNFESGLLGVSETSSDMADLLAAEESDPRAADAISLFCYQIKKQIGAYAATLGGVDALVFSGGIGENAPEIRLRICEGLSFLGIHLDVTKNAENSLSISTHADQVKVFVIPTDEEQMMASMMQSILNH